MAFNDNFQLNTENERPGQFVAAFEPAGNSCKRTFKGNFRDYPDFVRAQLGYAEYVDGRIVRHQPFRDFQHRDMVAVRVEVYGSGMRDTDEFDQAPLTSAIVYLNAYCTVYYMTQQYELGTLADDPNDPMLEATPTDEVSRYCMKSVTPARELVAAAKGTFIWADASGNVPVGPEPQLEVSQEVPLAVGYEDIRVTFVGWPYNAIPFTAIDRCLNTVNSNLVELPNRPPPRFYNPAELYLQNYGFVDVVHPLGDLPQPAKDYRAVNLTYFYKRRLAGWQTEITPKGEFRVIYRKSTVGGDPADYKKKFPAEDHGALFQPEPA